MTTLKSLKEVKNNGRTNSKPTTSTKAKEPIKLIIKRQDNNESKPYYEEFEIPYKENLNVIACLMYIRRNPVNAKGEKQHLLLGT